MALTAPVSELLKNDLFEVFKGVFPLRSLGLLCIFMRFKFIQIPLEPVAALRPPERTIPAPANCS